MQKHLVFVCLLVVGSLKCWQRFYILNWGKIAGLWGTLLLMTGWAISFNSTHWFKGEWQLHCQTWQYNHCQLLLQASFYEVSVLHFKQLSSFFFWSGKNIWIRLSNLSFFSTNIGNPSFIGLNQCIVATLVWAIFSSF